MAAVGIYMWTMSMKSLQNNRTADDASLTLSLSCFVLLIVLFCVVFKSHVNALRTTDGDARFCVDLWVDRVIKICNILEPVKDCERGERVAEFLSYF